MQLIVIFFLSEMPNFVLICSVEGEGICLFISLNFILEFDAYFPIHSERADSTGATGDRLKEGSAINQSLSSLGNVIKGMIHINLVSAHL